MKRSDSKQMGVRYKTARRRLPWWHNRGADASGLHTLTIIIIRTEGHAERPARPFHAARGALRTGVVCWTHGPVDSQAQRLAGCCAAHG